jgi:flagellar hook-associated protein 1 FlgK
MSLFTSLYAARSGLRAASSGIAVVSHNVANAATEGFSRRRIVASTSEPVRLGNAWFGTGVSVKGVSRVTDQLIAERVVRITGKEARATSSRDILSSLEKVAFDGSTGRSSADLLSAFYDSMRRLSTDPSDRSLRAAMVTSGVALADNLNQTSRSMTETLDGIVAELRATVDGIQEKLDKIASLNRSVAQSGQSLGAGDFADDRDQLIAEVAEELGATVDFTNEGQATLFVGGHAIVSGGVARTLAIGGTPAAPTITVSADRGVIDLTALAGGRFGGMMDAFNTTSGLLTDLNTFAADLATNVNTQHTAGFDLNGVAGIDFFTVTAGTEGASIAVDATIEADPGLVAAAGAVPVGVGDGDNLALLIGLEDGLNFSGATVTGEDALADIFAELGREVSTADLNSQALATEKSDLAELRESVSGVSLDEEATSLISWQAAYQASSRVVTATNQLLGELMEMVR